MPQVADQEKNELERAIERIALLENQLAEQQNLFHQLMEEVNHGYWRWQIPTNQWYYSPACCQLLGYSGNELSVGDSYWEQIVIPTQLSFFKHQLDILNEGKEDSFVGKLSLQKTNGEVVRVLCKGKVIEWDEQKKPKVVLGTVEPIESEQESQDELNGYADALRMAAQIIPGLQIFIFDRDFRYILAEGSDLSPEEKQKFVGNTLYDLQTPAEILVLEPFYQSVMQGERQEKELMYRGTNYHVQFLPLERRQEVNYGMVIAVNISQVRTIEYQLSTFIKQAPVAMAILDNEMKYITVTKRWLEDYEIENKNIIGISHYEVFPEISQEWKDIHQECLQGEVRRKEEDRFLREDGTEQWMRWEVSPWYKRKNKVGGLMMMTEDITQRKNSELALKRHQHGLKILTAISSSHQLSLAEQLQEVLLSVADYFDLPFGIISHIEDEIYTIEYGVSRDDDLQFEIGVQFDLKHTYCSIAYAQNDTVAIPSMEDSVYHSHPCYQQFNVETYIGSPIWVGGKKYGTINFSSPEKRLLKFTEEDIDFMRLVARWVGATLERYANELQLVAARREAEEATQAKTDFLSTISHEIRTPMNAVVGMAHLLLEEDPREDQINSLKTLKFSADLLLSLINDILDFSKIEAGKITLESVDFNLKDLLQGIKSAQGIKAQEKQVKMKLHWDDDVPEMVIGDPVRLGQIINNLVNNAVKFTAEGQVTLEVELKEKTDERVSLGFAVRDTGIGIPEDKFNTIFEEFSQASNSTTRKFGGTGLGLAITKRLLELQNSQIHVKSEEGEGSTFFFTLTLGNSTKEVVSTGPFLVDSSEDYMGGLRGARILLVEDNYINQYVAARFIVKWQVDLDTADNGAEALKKVQAKDYDLILMDLQMPVVDGYEATKSIRAWQEENNKPRIPIIALTASTTHSVREKVISVGMNGFVSKPFVPKELFARLQHYLMKEETLNSKPIAQVVAAQEIEEVIDIPSTQKSNFNFEFLEQLADGNPEVLLDLCVNYQEMVQEFIDDLRTFLGTADQELLRKSIHRVQSTFQMFGAETLSQLLGQVSNAEDNAKVRLIEETLDCCENLNADLRKFRQDQNLG